FLSDRTRTKWGRRRPWLILGTPLMVLSFILFFNVPAVIQSEKGMLFIYMLLMYIMTGTLDSLMNANYGALFPELFKTDTERAKTNGVRQVFQLLAMAISIAMTPIVADAIGYNLTALIYGNAALAVMMYCYLGCTERMDYEAHVKPKLFGSIFDLLRNGKFWIFGIANALYSAAFALISQAIPFYVKYSPKLDSGMTTVMLGVVLGVAVIGIVVWSLVLKRFAVMKVWRIGFIVMAAGFIPLYFAPSLAAALAIECVMGFGVAGCLITMDCISAKIVDDDFARHGIKREGMIASLVGVMNRLNGLFTSLAFYVTAEAFGFVNGDNPGDNPGAAAKMLLCVFPAIAMVTASVFTFFLHFKEDGENG
ncbi:MAG: MFS transporter, partial [Clostridiales bacterium]|nr:MFS transporter [Clostridiales bacterium]